MVVSTIAAISTPPGYGGVGVIRISGPDALSAALRIFTPRKFTSHTSSSSNGLPSSFLPKSRYLYHGYIVEINSNIAIDEVLFVVMRGPASFTGEDVVEIHSHGGPMVLQAILKLLTEQGICLAGPGEFTRRAFLNNRMDLTQAEAVIDIIRARSEKAMKIAVAQVSGDLRRKIQAIHDAVLEIAAYVDAAIDFPDAVDDDIDTLELADRLDRRAIDEIARLIDRSDAMAFLREGLKIVIAGAPNVGKSSLMNRLVSRDRSIVSDIPGTTRDFIEEPFNANGIPIVLIDTAGIHEAEDPVERMGIDKAWETINRGDLILLVMDAGRIITFQDREIVTRLCDKNLILVINKKDLPASKQLFVMPEEWRFLTIIEVSALRNQGIEQLREMIFNQAAGRNTDIENAIIPNLRHRQCLDNALQSLLRVREGITHSLPFELISLDLRGALSSLSEIFGEGVNSDILDLIFDRFCIGK